MNLRQVVQWFELGGTLRLDETISATDMVQQLSRIQDLFAFTGKLGLGVSESDALRASTAEFILEGLYAQKRISRNEQLAFTAGERQARADRNTDEEFRRGFEGRRNPGGRRNLN